MLPRDPGVRIVEDFRVRDNADRTDNTYRELFEHSADAILIIDGETFVDCNQATVDMLRYQNKEELLQTHPSELSPEYQSDGRRSYEKASEMIAIAFERGSHRFEWDHMRADGEVFPVEVLLTAVTSRDKKLLHVVWRDITDRKRLEVELRQAQKMEAIGRLSGGIAHDFNNLLVAILGHVEILEHETLGDESRDEHLREIRRAGERAANLVSQLLAFGRKQVMQPKVVDLNDAVADLHQMLSRLIGEHIQLRCLPHRDALPVLVDPGQLDQVILNLAANARDAMPAGGTLSIEASMVEVAPGTDTIDPDLKPGDYARLVVEDDGVGIPSEVLPRIFDPFYTTKPRGKGTGLGLSTVYGIVKQSHGAIAIDSEPEQGTRVSLLLPLSDETPGTPMSDEAGAKSGRDLEGNETILVVEDEEAVGNLVEEVLRRNGYTVHRAGNGEEAVERVTREGLEFDLLLTDVVMPRMGGPALAEALSETRPEMKVLYASGYTDDALMPSGALDPGVELISKPFSPRVLLRRVREILDRPVE